MLQTFRGQFVPEGELPEGLELIANPLGGNSAADRQSRVFERKSGPGVTYDAFVIRLCWRVGLGRRSLVIFVQHGGGHELAHLYTGPDAEAVATAFLAMPERTLYAALFSIWHSMRDTKEAAEQGTASDWRRATLDKRVRVSRQPAKGRAFAWIEPERAEGESEAQHALRVAFAKPAGVR